jgi:hypothetical protein
LGVAAVVGAALAFVLSVPIQELLGFDDCADTPGALCAGPAPELWHLLLGAATAATFAGVAATRSGREAR